LIQPRSSQLAARLNRSYIGLEARQRQRTDSATRTDDVRPGQPHHQSSICVIALTICLCRIDLMMRTLGATISEHWSKLIGTHWNRVLQFRRLLYGPGIVYTGTGYVRCPSLRRIQTTLFSYFLSSPLLQKLLIAVGHHVQGAPKIIIPRKNSISLEF